MKLYYYQRPDGQPNFGDELNRWLWPQLLPNFFDQNADSGFVGTGTLLNARLPERLQTARQVVILGTGAGYEQPLKEIPPHWRICCVRGPLSAQQLGLLASKAVADSGILVSRVFSAESLKRHRVSFMPHIHHANYAAARWQAACQSAGINYIDPRWPVEKVLTHISQSQRLLAEAMHGAIVADALRVPWIPVVTSPRILAFKWQDWCQSVGLKYRPQYIPPLSQYPQWGRGLRSGVAAATHWGRAGRQGGGIAAQALIDAQQEWLTEKLTDIAVRIEPSLSDIDVLSVRLAQLADHLEHLKVTGTQARSI
ncbi:MAG: polysaccharide pyruvyl transferase family protein [Cyanobacteria bacterium J06626_23]